MQKQRGSLIEVSGDGSHVRLRPDATVRVQRKRVVLDYLYAPLGNLPMVSCGRTPLMSWHRMCRRSSACADIADQQLTMSLYDV